jgi:hypothetical protein
VRTRRLTRDSAHQASTTRRRTVIISASIVTLLALFTFIAAIANTFDWSGWWVVTVVIMLAALTLGWKLWTDVVQPSRQRAQVARVEQVHRQAVQLSLTDHNNSAVGVSITNHGTHEVRHIEIVGIPEGGDMDPMLTGPPFSPIDGGPPVVTVTRMPAGDLYAVIAPHAQSWLLHRDL